MNGIVNAIKQTFQIDIKDFKALQTYYLELVKILYNKNVIDHNDYSYIMMFHKDKHNDSKDLYNSLGDTKSNETKEMNKQIEKDLLLLSNKPHDYDTINELLNKISVNNEIQPQMIELKEIKKGESKETQTMVFKKDTKEIGCETDKESGNTTEKLNNYVTSFINLVLCLLEKTILDETELIKIFAIERKLVQPKTNTKTEFIFNINDQIDCINALTSNNKKDDVVINEIKKIEHSLLYENVPYNEKMTMIDRLQTLNKQINVNTKPVDKNTNLVDIAAKNMNNYLNMQNTQSNNFANNLFKTNVADSQINSNMNFNSIPNFNSNLNFNPNFNSNLNFNPNPNNLNLNNMNVNMNNNLNMNNSNVVVDNTLLDAYKKQIGSRLSSCKKRR